MLAMYNIFVKYKVGGIVLLPYNEDLDVSLAFDQKQIYDELKDILEAMNLKYDENSFAYRDYNGHLYVVATAWNDD